MGCNCGSSGAVAAKASVQTYVITDDPDQNEYLTQRDALDMKIQLGLSGEVVPKQ